MPRKSKSKGDVYGPRGRYRSSGRRGSSRGISNDVSLILSSCSLSLSEKGSLEAVVKGREYALVRMYVRRGLCVSSSTLQCQNIVSAVQDVSRPAFVPVQRV